ncbi:unnamed protein product [Didymodactylos carnosus]|uniref:RNA-directed DNA polymerase n=1 Tax=Didymodactylos carnosus TaxID=1234261 RepID=A0A8S2E3A0_9BILA|nr:unnamed protein product [Didymodactylos carnosus]CAF3813895.1 unnamed protein product [Didymodactylos carnosus]
MWCFRPLGSELHSFSITESTNDGVVSDRNNKNPSKSSLIFITTLINNKRMRVMIDTGATRTLINEKSLRQTKHKKYINKTQLQFVMADGCTPFKVVGETELSIKMGHKTTRMTAYIAKNLYTDCILGMDYVNKHNLKINSKKQIISIGEKSEKIRINMDKDIEAIQFPVTLTQQIKIPPQQYVQAQVSVGISAATVAFKPFRNFNQQLFITTPDSLLNVKQHTATVSIYNPSSHYPRFMPKGKTLGQSTIFPDTTKSTHLINLISNIDSDNTTPRNHIKKLIQHVDVIEQRKQLETLLLQYNKLFDTSKTTIANTTISHAIDTIPHPPPCSKPYRTTQEKHEALYKMCQQLMESGLISPSNSPYAAPALLTPKKDGSWRMVVDYKKLNKITLKDNYPLPNMEQTLQNLGIGYKYFTKLDLKSGFWQFPIREADKRKTAFITPFGLYHFNVLPQGLKNSPPTFQRVMTNVLQHCRNFSMVYLDDIIVYSRTFEEHCQHLKQVFMALTKNNLQLNPPKCAIAQSQIDYLGHSISSTTVTPLKEKIKSILEIPEPKSLRQANKFIGALAWYRKFIPQFASVAAPIHAITNLTKKQQHKFQWNKPQSEAFHKLKQLLTSTPLLLNFPDDTKPIILSTDASDVGIGGVLQQQINGNMHNIYYHSQLITSAQKKYDTIEKEALAIWLCIKRMRPFLLGRNIIIYTDHCPICNMMERTVKNKRVDRISLLLQEYNIEKIIHIKGRHNCLPDYLSRHPIKNNVDDLVDYDYGLDPKLRNWPPSQVFAGAVTTRARAVLTPQVTVQQGRTRNKKENPYKKQYNTTRKSEQSSINDLTTTDVSSKTTFLSKATMSATDFSLLKIKHEQQTDQDIQDKTKHYKKNQSYEFVDGIFYKLITRGTTKIKLLHLPATLIKEILFLYHDHPSRELKLQQIPVPDEVLGMVGMDFWGPTQQPSANGNQYVVTMTDYLSKFVFAKPTPTNSAKDASQFFLEVVWGYGAPTKLLTDQGSHFVSELTNAIVKQCNTTHILSTPYHPMTNGQTERFNATFSPALAKLWEEEANNWDDFVPACVYPYNTGEHATTGYSPFQLMFGREFRLPIETKQAKITLSKPNNYYELIQKSRKILKKCAKANMEYQNQLTKKRFDQSRPDPNISLINLFW